MSFSNLAVAEASRLRHRSRATVVLLITLIVSLIGTPMFMTRVTPLTADDYAQAAAEYELSKETCSTCTVESYLPGVFDFHEVVHIGIGPWMLLLAVFVLLATLIYVGADFASGAITTQLTFTPNRMQLLGARTFASGLFGAAMLGIAVIASSVVSVVWYLGVHGLSSLPADSGLLGTISGSLILGFVLGMLASLLVFLFNGGAYAGATAAVVLIAAFALEMVAFDVASPAWLFHASPTRQAEALVVGLANPGYDQVPLHAAELLTPGESLLYFATLLAVTATLAAFAFQRRDITN